MFLSQHITIRLMRMHFHKCAINYKLTYTKLAWSKFMLNLMKHIFNNCNNKT